MNFKPIDKSRRAEIIAKHLRHSIFTGGYQPGEKIPSEHELSEGFGVSRIIVREAVRDLERSGLVEVKRGAYGGAFVKKMKHDAATSIMRDILELADARPTSILEVRMDIEPLIAGYAAERATSDDIKSMHSHLESDPKTPGHDYMRWNTGFHRLVAQASHNPVYNLLSNILLDLAEEIVIQYSDNRIYHDKTSHPAILEKIKQRDAQGAKQICYDHLLYLIPIHEKWDQSIKSL
jgi:DNA-binding FadR family transcriptional regulator